MSPFLSLVWETQPKFLSLACALLAFHTTLRLASGSGAFGGCIGRFCAWFMVCVPLEMVLCLDLETAETRGRIVGDGRRKEKQHCEIAFRCSILSYGIVRPVIVPSQVRQRYVPPEHYFLGSYMALLRSIDFYRPRSSEAETFPHSLLFHYSLCFIASRDLSSTPASRLFQNRTTAPSMRVLARQLVAKQPTSIDSRCSIFDPTTPCRDETPS